MNHLGQCLRKLREDRKMLLREVASFLDVDTALISKIERGERCATRPQISKLAHCFNTDEKELLTLWLADKLTSTLVEEPAVAYEALRIANKNFNSNERA